MKCYYVGNSETIVGNLLFTQLGDTYEFTQEELDHHISGSAGFVPEDVWNSAGFTKEELKKYDKPGKRISAPKEFQEKLQKLYKWVSERYMQLHNLNPDGSQKREETAFQPFGVAPIANFIPADTPEKIQMVIDGVSPEPQPVPEPARPEGSAPMTVAPGPDAEPGKPPHQP